MRLPGVSTADRFAIAGAAGLLVLVGCLCGWFVVNAWRAPRHRDLHRVRMLTPEMAAEAAEFSGSIDLGGLSTMSPDAARAIAKHSGALSLDGLGTISDEAAALLANHGGELSIAGLALRSRISIASELSQTRQQLFS